MKIVFCGDSIMQENDATTFPQVGWPQIFHRLLKDDIGYLNCAVNGRSTKSFIDNGLLHVAYSNTSKGDIVLISFGHNDSKSEDPSRYTTYEEYYKNLSYMVELFRKKGANVILVTSFSRLRYEDGKIKRTHLEYPNTMRKLAKDMNVPLIDLEEYSNKELSKRTMEENSELYMIFPKDTYSNYPEGKDDHTHLREKGALFVADYVKEEMQKLTFAADIFR